MYPAGTVLKINFGSYSHYGIANGLGKVIHNSKLRFKVAIDSYEDFAGGKEIAVSEITSENPESAIDRAMYYMGMPYNLFTSNCEHFVRLCHGLDKESTQIQQYALMALGAAIAMKSNNDMVKAAGGAIAIAGLITPEEENPYKNALVLGLLAIGIVALAA